MWESLKKLWPKWVGKIPFPFHATTRHALASIVMPMGVTAKQNIAALVSRTRAKSKLLPLDRCLLHFSVFFFKNVCWIGVQGEYLLDYNTVLEGEMVDQQFPASVQFKKISHPLWILDIDVGCKEISCLWGENSWGSNGKQKLYQRTE